MNIWCEKNCTAFLYSNVQKWYGLFYNYLIRFAFLGKNLLNKKEGANAVKESTDSSATIDEQDGEIKGDLRLFKNR